MRRIVIAALALAAPLSGAWAQGGTAQSPPSPNANSSQPAPPGSLPAGAPTMNPQNSPNNTGTIGTSTPGAPPRPAPEPMARTVPTPAVR